MLCFVNTWDKSHAYNPAPAKAGSIVLCIVNTWDKSHAYNPAPVKTGFQVKSGVQTAKEAYALPINLLCRLDFSGGITCLGLEVQAAILGIN